MMKIAVIIPAKGNPDVTIKCLESFYHYHCNPSVYTWKVFQADTGSSSGDLECVRQFALNQFTSEQFQLIEYDWYNFAKINNDVAFNHVDDAFTHYMFCNNDIEFTCNILDRSVELFTKNPKVIGTLGYRLIYPDGRIQHDGQSAQLASQAGHTYMHISHLNLRSLASTIKYDTVRKVLGNTFACVLTEASLFKLIGGLSEKYCECFEDVQYNLECLDQSRINLCLESKYSAIHSESLTRDTNPLKKQNEATDYKTLMNFWFRDRRNHKHA
jgi:GT2 family glycosyltransferase